jgi:hypothetical protein
MLRMRGSQAQAGDIPCGLLHSAIDPSSRETSTRSREPSWGSTCLLVLFVSRHARTPIFGIHKSLHYARSVKDRETWMGREEAQVKTRMTLPK